MHNDPSQHGHPNHGAPQGYPQQPQQPGYGGPTGGPAANPLQKFAIIFGVCAALILTAVVTKGWASASEGRDDINAGMFGFEGCGRGKCQSLDWEAGAKRLDIPSDVGTFRILGMIGGFGAISLLGFAAFMSFSRTPEKIPFKVVQGSLGFAAFTMTYFAMRLAMSDKDVNFGPSYSVFLAIGGLVAAGVFLKKLKGEVDAAYASVGHFAPQGAGAPQMGHAQSGYDQSQASHEHAHAGPAAQPSAAPQASGAAPTYPCASCNQTLVWVAEHQRWYCPPCQKYA